jgi:hypothetical protein
MPEDGGGGRPVLCRRVDKDKKKKKGIISSLSQWRESIVRRGDPADYYLLTKELIFFLALGSLSFSPPPQKLYSCFVLPTFSRPHYFFSAEVFFSLVVLPAILCGIFEVFTY